MLGNTTSHKKLNTNHDLHRSVEHRQRARILRLMGRPHPVPTRCAKSINQSLPTVSHCSENGVVSLI